MGTGSNPAPGWYPDPAGGGGVRYWDGGRWTDQTSGSDPTAGAPGAPPAPSTPGGPGSSAGAYGPQGAAAAGRPAGGGANQLVASVQQAPQEIKLVLAGAAVFLVAMFLPWLSADVDVTNTATGQSQSDSQSENGFHGDSPWLLLGSDVPSEEDLAQTLQTGSESGGSGFSDAILILLLVLGAGAIAVMWANGNRNPRFPDVILGLGAAAAVLCALEAWAFSSAAGELDDRLSTVLPQFGATGGASGGPSFGLWLGLAASALIAVMGFRLRQSQQAAAGPTPPPGPPAGYGYPPR